MRSFFSILISTVIISTTWVSKALAQADVLGINDFSNTNIALGSRSLEDTIGGIINVFLGFLGVLAVLLILYAGFLWMTSNGNADKVQRAKLLLISALIGLVIIVSAYAISRFILSRLYEVTEPGGGGGPGGPGGPGNITCSEPADLTEAVVCSLSSASGPVGSNLTLRGYHFDTDGQEDRDLGRVTIGGLDAEVVTCGSSDYWYDRRVRVKVPDALPEGLHQVVLYNDLGNESTENPKFDFLVTAGTASVVIDCLVPGEAPAAGLPQSVQVLGRGFTDTEETISMTGWVAGAEATLSNVDLNVTSWTDLQINIDVPSNALASYVEVTVGPDSDKDYFDITCTLDGQCSSGCCYGLSCLPADACSNVIPGASAPVIEGISPDNGEDGTFVTIYGYNFGDSANPGTVTIGGAIAGAPSCGQVWNDDYIVVAVPAGANGLQDVVVTQAAVVGGEISDPYTGFDRNDTVRPGICALSPIDGVYGDNIDVDGANFAAGDTAYFDTVASYQTTVVDGNNITTQVPNVVGSLGLTIQSSGGVDSNALPFTALASTSGLPVITEITPDNGPVDSYITIRGSNFGNIQGVVRFDTALQNEPGLFDFPSACGDTWSDSEIIVKVPAGSPAFAPGDYLVDVVTNDGNDSNDYEFSLNNNLLGPQICAVSPNNGPVGNLVTVSGENFGPQAGGALIFFEGVNATAIANWSGNQIFNAAVPVGASTGPLVVRDADGNTSNPILFTVGSCTSDLQCGGGVCCEGESGNYCAASCGVVLNQCSYEWDINTQSEPLGLYYNYSCDSDAQSPSPWPDGHEGFGSDGFLAPQSSLDAFVDTQISARFTRNIRDIDFNTTNIQLWECGNGVNFDPLTCVNQINEDDNVIQIISPNTSREGFIFSPANNLQAGRWYEVRLGAFHSEVGNDTWSPDPVADQWHFRTREDGLLCEVTSVAISPQPSAANMYPGAEKNFSALPVGDNCNICGGDYDWQWSISHNPGPATDYAAIVGPINNPNVNTGFTRLAGGPMSTQLLTGGEDTFVTISAENTDFGVSGDSYPVILSPALRVLDHEPSCDDSCQNASVWVDFNTDLMQPLNLADFSIRQCTDASCSAFAGGQMATNITGQHLVAENVYRVEIEHNNFTAGNYYFVTVAGSVTNIYGYPLNQGNPVGYSWQFRVGDENCSLDGVNISPANYTAYNLNNINYTAYPYSQTGSCGAQPVQCDDCVYDWASSAAGVATIDTGAKSVYASPVANGNTNISVQVNSPTIGNANNATPLTVNISGGGSNITQLAVDSWYPDCDGSCANPLVQILFNSPLQTATVNDTNFQVIDLDNGNQDVTTIVDLAANNRLVTIHHQNFVPGHRYRMQFNDQVFNLDGDNIAGGGFREFTTGDVECVANAMVVQPQNATAGASDTLGYYGQAVVNNVDGCQNPVPVACPTCTYQWQNNLLGSFDDVSLQDPDFTTFAGVNDGDNTAMTLNAWESGNPLVVNDGFLTIDLSVAGPGADMLVVDRWPDCDGACDNSQTGVRFSAPVNEPSLAGNFSVFNITDGIDITNGYILSGGNRTLTIEHDPLELGKTYRVSVLAGIENNDGNALAASEIWAFTVGEVECQITGAAVDPVAYTAGPLEGINYSAVTTANTVSCGSIPVYCDSCSYSWDPAPLGNWNNASLENPRFTTLDAPPLLDGDSTTINLTVSDQGQSFPASGTLDIAILPNVFNQASLVAYAPSGLNECNNAASYAIFNVALQDVNNSSITNHLKLYEACNNPGPWCQVDASIRFSVLAPGFKAAILEQRQLLNINTTHLVLFDDFSQVLSSNGQPVIDMTGSLNSYPAFGPNALGWEFTTGADSCEVNRVEIEVTPTPASNISLDDFFTCLEPNGCEGDQRGAVGNQHRYSANTYDIRGNLLSSALLNHNWFNITGAVVLDSNVTNPVYSTANVNGQDTVSVATQLAATPGNVVSDSIRVGVNACQEPWPSMASYPWEDGVYHFSSYYCIYYGAGSERLPYIDTPGQRVSTDPNVLREYITTIFYGAAYNYDKYFGSLAYEDKVEAKEKEDKLASIFDVPNAEAQWNGNFIPDCIPRVPNNLNYTYDGANTVVFSWRQGAAQAMNEDPDHFLVYRRHIGVDQSSQIIANVPFAGIGNYSITDSNVEPGNIYHYSVEAINDQGANACDPDSWGPTAPMIVNTSEDGSLVDIIAFRVMRNDEHLSVVDWYKKFAPNPEENGSLLEVDGYQALQVGSTIYVAGSNIVNGAAIYTNIFIISHNIGARAQTLEIYSQLLDNFKINTNLWQSITLNTNVCHNNPSTACSSDYDCPANDYCLSYSDKLRRDVLRLGQVKSVSNLIELYGQSHKACANNSLISCDENADCPNSLCTEYYPPLNAGTYLEGLSNSSWPSWQGTLAGVLGVSQLGQDPINRFNGCEDPYDPQTCWDEVAREFMCPADSLIYLYSTLLSGRDYELGLNFEYDLNGATLGVTFRDDLATPPANIRLNLDSYCDASVINPPGSPINDYCGNGILDANYCSVPCGGSCGQIDCVLAGGIWITQEECDGGIWNQACSEAPPGAPAGYPIVGNQNWWNEQTVGCNPPGAIDPVSGNLIECTWYEPEPPFTPQQCGGYCGDGTVQPFYESCDGALPAGNYTCAEADDVLFCGSGCQVMCDDNSNLYPAALCGDGIWSEGMEQCDPTANPNGLSGWDCTQGGSIQCNNSCQRVCTSGSPYAGLCGDGNTNSPAENCDYVGYDAPLPIDSAIDNTYGCTLQCLFNGQYCGDGVAQYAFQELCDWNGAYAAPEPLFSDINTQYECATNCTPTIGGYCGDGAIQIAYGEECDPGSPWDGIPANPPALPPDQTDQDNQYVCDVDCVGTTGGWCGDGDAHPVYEVCDGLDYPGRPTPPQSGINNTYTCANDCSGGAVGGGYCGDEIEQFLYGEGCDWGNPVNPDNYPWPLGDDLVGNFSAPDNQYACSSCINFGGYCGDGVVDGACSVACSLCDANGNNCQSSAGCTEFACTSRGGNFFPYEQCDNGFDPAYIVNKDVDIAYIFDMSGSMEPPAQQLCQSTATVVNTLNTDHTDINYRITIFVMGDGSAADGTGAELTATETDNIQFFYNFGAVPSYDQVFDALYSDCDQLVDDATGITIDPRVRYLSLYDDATNDIDGVVDYYGDPNYQTCDRYAGTENWGYAIKRIAEDYNWLPNYHRIIVPVSDEYGSCGGTGLAQSVEDFNNSVDPVDILVDAVAACNANPDNPIYINPVLLQATDFPPATDLEWIGPMISDATGGLFTNSPLDWEVQTLQVINSTICDGTGPAGVPDGHMDCVLDPNWDPVEPPPPPPPPCGANGQSCCSGNMCIPGLICDSGTCEVFIPQQG